MRFFSVCLVLSIVFAAASAALIFGSIYLKQRDYDKLIEGKDFAGAIELDPDNAETYISLAHNLSENGVKIVEEKAESEETSTAEKTAEGDETESITEKKEEGEEPESVTVDELAGWFSDENLSTLRTQFPGEYVDVNYTVGMLIWNKYDSNSGEVMKAAMPYFENVISAIKDSPDLLDADATAIVKAFYKLSYLSVNNVELCKNDKDVSLTETEEFVGITQKEIENKKAVYSSLMESCTKTFELMKSNKSATPDTLLKTYGILNYVVNKEKGKLFQVGEISLDDIKAFMDTLLEAAKGVDVTTDDQKSIEGLIEDINTTISDIAELKQKTYNKLIEDKNYVGAIKLDPEKKDAYIKFANYLDSVVRNGVVKIVDEKSDDGKSFHVDELYECFSDDNLSGIKELSTKEYIDINYNVGMALWNNYVRGNISNLKVLAPYFERVLSSVSENSTESHIDKDSEETAKKLYKLSRLNCILGIIPFTSNDLTDLDKYVGITEANVSSTENTCVAMKETCDVVLELFGNNLTDEQRESVKNRVEEEAVPNRWEY